MEKKNILYAIIPGLALAATPAFAEHHKQEICNGASQPIISVADFDGDGVVTEADIGMLRNVVRGEIYYAFYDISVDGKVDGEDVKVAQAQLGQPSTPLDRQLTLLFHRNKQMQLHTGARETIATGYMKIAESLAGHGEHWIDIVDGSYGKFLRPDGLNLEQGTGDVKGVFWSVDAVPVFANGATDYPTPGGMWQESRVVAFANQPPVFTGSEHEHWHTHAGLCITAQLGANGPEIVLNQHTSFNECQAIPSIAKDPETGYNAWFNLWMLHAWMFDINPNGVFANTHPCVDPDAVSESSINGGREVPPFFQHGM